MDGWKEGRKDGFCFVGFEEEVTGPSCVCVFFLIVIVIEEGKMTRPSCVFFFVLPFFWLDCLERESDLSVVFFLFFLFLFCWRGNDSTIIVFF